MARQRYEDPTHTRTLADRYASRLRSPYDNIITVVNEYVGDDDLLELTAAELTAEPPHPDPERYRFRTDAAKVNRFAEWLRSAQESEVLEVVSIDENRYVKQAYESGLRAANDDLRSAGFTSQLEDADALKNQPVHERTLQDLFTRNYEGTDTIQSAIGADPARGLTGLADDVVDEVRVTLTEAYSEGVNPNVAAKRIVDRIDKVGKTGATQLARSEIVNAHNQAALRRFEQILGPGAEIEVEAEIMSAGDRRVCDICESHHRERMSIAEAKVNGPLFHTQCRCTVRSRFSER